VEAVAPGYPADDHHQLAVDALCREAFEAADVTCQTCGATGATLRHTGAWWRTLCDPCDQADQVATTDRQRETLARMVAHRHRQNPPPPPSPNEIILEATVKGSPRDELLSALIEYPYTFSQLVGDGTDAVALGNWTQVAAAHLGELLSDDEYRRITDAVQPPPYL